MAVARELLIRDRDLPPGRGPISSLLVEHLRRPPHRIPVSGAISTIADPLSDDDLQLALYVCYEMHDRGFADASDQWGPSLIRFRTMLEQPFEAALAAAVGSPSRPVIGTVREAIHEVIAQDAGPSLSRHMQDHGTFAAMRELTVHRSAYQLKGPDPTRFAATMRALELDDSYGAYLDRLPGTTLATINLMSMLGLHRRWQGALVGHLATFEMMSVEPMARYAAALERLGIGEEGRAFYDVHEHVAGAMVDALADDEPALASQIVFGARCVLEIERRFAAPLLAAWERGRSSLLPD